MASLYRFFAMGAPRTQAAIRQIGVWTNIPGFTIRALDFAGTFHGLCNCCIYFCFGELISTITTLNGKQFNSLSTYWTGFLAINEWSLMAFGGGFGYSLDILAQPVQFGQFPPAYSAALRIKWYE
ncbi:MAG: hypothetical protein QXP27_03735 [Candidatus Methanomethyliaceae archaeon]